MIFHTTTLPNSLLRSDAHIWLHSWVAEPSLKTQETGGNWTILFTQLLTTTVPSITILQYIFRDKEIARCVCGSLIYVHFCDLSYSVLQYFKLTKVIKKWLSNRVSLDLNLWPLWKESCRLSLDTKVWHELFETYHVLVDIDSLYSRPPTSFDVLPLIMQHFVAY